MNSFYSLIKISPNSFTEDAIVLGMILSDGGHIHFKCSELKKRVIKSLLKEDSKMIDLIIKELGATIQKTNDQKKKAKGDIFDLNHLLSEDYFQYLSKYSNGILSFTQPKAVLDVVNQEKFNQLFRLFVDQAEDVPKAKSKEKEVQFYNRINKKLIQRVEKKVHTNIELDSTFAPTLLSVFKIDCIGKNGSFIGAKTLPLTKSIATLHKDLNTYISVIAHLRNYEGVKEEGNQFYLISDEPKSKKTDEFRIYKHLKESESIFKLISSNESDEVAEQIESKNAKRFLELVD